MVMCMLLFIAGTTVHTRKTYEYDTPDCRKNRDNCLLRSSAHMHDIEMRNHCSQTAIII